MLLGPDEVAAGVAIPLGVHFVIFRDGDGFVEGGSVSFGGFS